MKDIFQIDADRTVVGYVQQMTQFSLYSEKPVFDCSIFFGELPVTFSKAL